ncbi:hypothetical protein RYX56_05615 [Alkalihalophilus lindianensis]|uniref:DUF5067 domain-containing protein n=1 Tax=Alkalihalophilus lindianensis TaxID=1630542 RepID=A0ABU3X890_9BACI|nr:hypothetical protein [Alkalihalophilus lindianensis]MDV2683786.1 hypothetical protein [Alkalihalophilus lindianensis]MDV2683852.1 hypothetical protein [Alkalihalophilus lindianensis]
MKKLLGLSLALTFVLSACGNNNYLEASKTDSAEFSNEQYEQLENGMSAKAIYQLVGGQPHYSHESDTGEITAEYLKEDQTKVLLKFNNDELTSFTEFGTAVSTSSSSNTNNSDTSSAPSVSSTSLEVITESIIKELIGNQALNTDKPRVESINSIEDVIAGEDNYILTLELNANEHRTAARTKDDMLLNSKEILPPIFEEEGISEVQLNWILPLTEASGNQIDKTVMTIALRSENAENINWETFNIYDFESAADRYYEDNALNN